jgi:hypothetical protein
MIELKLQNSSVSIDVEYLIGEIKKMLSRSHVSVDIKNPNIVLSLSKNKTQRLESSVYKDVVTINLNEESTVFDVVTEIAHELLHYYSNGTGVASFKDEQISYESFDEGLTDFLAQRLATSYCRIFGFPLQTLNINQVYEEEKVLVKQIVERLAKAHNVSEDLVIDGLIFAYFTNQAFSDPVFKQFFKEGIPKDELRRLEYLNNSNREALGKAIK